MFNINRYEELIRYLLNAGLKPTTSWNKKMNTNTLLLRHDVDFSIDYAYEIAQLESKLKVCSTFFFMLTSNMYNFLSAHNQKLVKDIANMGHKVSIHFDPTVYQNLNKFSIEKNIFENIINKKVDIVSIHRPGPFLDENNELLSGIPQTYQDIYFKKMKYISDSGGRDVFPLIAKYLEDPGEFGLHLLIHPIWWLDKGMSPTKALNSWRTQYLDFITSEIKKNCKRYDD
jgi:hypothetical protein